MDQRLQSTDSKAIKALTLLHHSTYWWHSCKKKKSTNFGCCLLSVLGINDAPNGSNIPKDRQNIFIAQGESRNIIDNSEAGSFTVLSNETLSSQEVHIQSTFCPLKDTSVLAWNVCLILIELQLFMHPWTATCFLHAQHAKRFTYGATTAAYQRKIQHYCLNFIWMLTSSSTSATAQLR